MQDKFLQLSLFLLQRFLFQWLLARINSRDSISSTLKFKPKSLKSLFEFDQDQENGKYDTTVNWMQLFESIFIFLINQLGIIALLKGQFSQIQQQLELRASTFIWQRMSVWPRRPKWFKRTWVQVSWQHFSLVRSTCLEIIRKIVKYKWQMKTWLYYMVDRCIPF